MNETETASDTATSELPISGNADTTTAKPRLKPRGKPFVAGDPRSNIAGRPRKGHSVLEETQKLAERKAKRVAEATVARLLRDDAVGNRAWSDYRDTFHGVPKATLVLERGDDPLTALLMDITQAGGIRADITPLAGERDAIYIEGPAGADDEAAT